MIVTSRHLPSRRRGVTLIELLIGLSITAVTCAILAVLINATAMGTSTQNDGRRALVRLQSVKAVLEDEFVNARCILATGTNYVVYWTGDSSGPTPVNNAVNFAELRMLEIDSSGNLNVYSAKWPAGTSSATILANDTEYALGTDWRATALALKGTTYYSTTPLATGATSLTCSLDNASPSAAKMINLQVAINDGVVVRQLTLSVTLANPLAPW
ncbi:MAG TPA: prepilin-type N-terminal cleavage/methylation domain-containing protein [Phycisphaerae bacterium]|nr:prepilin-type N-terminal cleavage/methylation domain-containing protein [Phycisphaerae bacterium]